MGDGWSFLSPNENAWAFADSTASSRLRSAEVESPRSKTSVTPSPNFGSVCQTAEYWITNNCNPGAYRYAVLVKSFVHLRFQTTWATYPGMVWLILKLDPQYFYIWATFVFLVSGRHERLYRVSILGVIPQLGSRSKSWSTKFLSLTLTSNGIFCPASLEDIGKIWTWWTVYSGVDIFILHHAQS